MVRSSRVNESQAPGSSSQLTASPTSLLNQLWAPTRLELTWKQKVRVNAPSHTGARKKRPACSADPKGVSVAHIILALAHMVAEMFGLSIAVGVSEENI